MVSVEQQESTFLTRLHSWFGGGDSTGFILKMLAPSIFVFLIGIFFPLLYGVFISFYYFRSYTDNFYVAFQNYTWMFRQDGFWQAYINTLFFTFTTVTIELFLGLLIALMLNKEFKGRGIVRAAILVPWAVPTIVNAILWTKIFASNEGGPVNDILLSIGAIDETITFAIFKTDVNFLKVFMTITFLVTFFATVYNLYTKYTDKFAEKIDYSTKEIIMYVILGISFIFAFFMPDTFYYSGAGEFATVAMNNQWLPVLIVDVWKTTPFMALLILAGLQVIPKDLLKAAEVDGANAWQKFRNVTFPLLLPSIGVALLFRLIDAFRVYDIFTIFNDRGIESISVFAVRLHSGGNWGRSATVAIFTFLNIIVMTIITMTLTRRRTDI